jgi:hypothetical protein
MTLTRKQWALLAQEAYTTAPSLGQEDSAGRVVFVQSEQGLILSMPGTNNAECVLADLDAIPYDTGAFGIVHRGIWEAFYPILDDVAKLDVYGLVGHSEGAAGALYLAARLCLIGKAPKIVYAWEPPRTSLDSKLSDIFIKYGVEVHIMYHGEDIVPTVPFDLPLLPWQHAGTVERFGNASLPFPNFEDHLIANIVADL